MRICQASMSSRILKRYWDLFKELLNILLSFAYAGPDFEEILVKRRHMVGNIVLDSGTWTASKGNSNITLAGLISYIQTVGHLFDGYFNYDIDFSDRGFVNNIVNQIIMERAGLHPIPVIHNLFDAEIDYYIDSGKYDFLALGSRQITNFDDLAYAVYRIKKGNPAIKIHWFGGSRYEWLCNLPIASCDTSSWGTVGKFGFIRYWNPHVPGINKGHSIYTSGVVKDIEEGKYEYVTYPWRSDLDAFIQNTFGLTFQDLCGYEAAFNMQLINTRFYAEQERRINEERIRRGIELE